MSDADASGLRTQVTPRRVVVGVGTLGVAGALALHSPTGALAGVVVLVAVALAPAPLGIALGQAAVGATIGLSLTPQLALAEAGLLVAFIGQVWLPTEQGTVGQSGRGALTGVVVVALAAGVLVGGDVLGLAPWGRYALVALAGATLLYTGHRYEVVLRARAES